MSTLIEIVDRLTHLLATVDDADGEIDETLEADLDEAEAALDAKVAACLRYRDDLAALAAARKDRATSLLERSWQADAQAKRLHEYVRRTLVAAGLKKLEAGDYACTIAAPSKSVVIEDEPRFVEWARDNRSDLLRYTAPAPAKAEIAKALKGGEELPGCSLVDGESGLRVK